MPIVKLNNAYLTRLTGADIDKIRASLPMMGSEVEREDEEQTDVQFFPNRPDLYSAEGTARALRGYLGIETGLPTYEVTPSGISFSVDPNLANIRPYLGSAVIRNVHMDNAMIESLMGLQESLHWAVGRGRKKVAIGPMYSALILSLIHISEPTRPLYISYAVFCLKKKKNPIL
eukprot:TRINITY_DN20160_c0_g2_i1.p3 TRINITY_DN20160_c0_g2~~TRINITY_DN20160_c0_g2_i1.p3  ORF type:complete len:174 (-),score=38.12 TRINITY_DN20160_c0_g2_i1:104-625(-)